MSRLILIPSARCRSRLHGKAMTVGVSSGVSGLLPISIMRQARLPRLP